MLNSSKSIIIIILIFVIILILYYNYTLSFNLKRHLTDSYNYAHFSKINKYNYFLNINYLLNADNYYVELNEGESLYIPGKMWHWIITDNNSFSINFWFDIKNPIIHNNYKINPVMTKQESMNVYKEFINIIKTNEMEIWDSHKDDIINIDYDKLIKGNNKNKTFITLDGYNLKRNNEIKRKLLGKIKKPKILSDINKNSFYDVNLWYTNDYHDTGLHYDDYDGILHLIKGKKRVYLYPYEYTKYLSPYNIIPDYALTKPIFMNYNRYEIYSNKCNKKSKSSQFLLYKTIDFFSKSKNINKIFQEIFNLCKNSKKLIWGFKKKDNIYRWEIYIYNFSINDFNLTDKNCIFLQDRLLNMHTSNNVINELLNNPKLIINSFDIFNLNNNFLFPSSSSYHTYEKKFINNNNKEFYGYGFDIENGIKRKVGEFIYDSRINFILNAKKYLESLKLPYNLNILNILKKYDCVDMCVWNKLGNLFVQWLVISVEDFINFLTENNYKKEFVQWIKDNSKLFKDISHEITIVYDSTTLEPIRSGFYGCL